MDITYYTTYDLPIPYKSILIYPIKVQDYLLFSIYNQCLSLDKNSIPDVKIISMTYLEYIYYETREDVNNKPYLLWLDRLFSLCIHDKTFENIEESIKRYGFDKNKKPIFTIGDETFNSEDFEEIKQIIAQQNMIVLPDFSVSKEVRDSLEKAKEYKNKISDSKPASLEDYIISLAVVTGWDFDKIYSLSIRKFMKAIERYDLLVHYKIYLASSMSGMVEFKDKSFIKHWLSNTDTEDKYKDVSINLEEIQNKISFESAKN